MKNYKLLAENVRYLENLKEKLNHLSQEGWNLKETLSYKHDQVVLILEREAQSEIEKT